LLQDSRWYEDALVDYLGLKKLAYGVQKVGHPCCRVSGHLEHSQSFDFYNEVGTDWGQTHEYIKEKDRQKKAYEKLKTMILYKAIRQI